MLGDFSIIIIAVAIIIALLPIMWLSQCAANTKQTVKLLKELLEQSKPKE